MSGIKVSQFSGIAPKQSSRLLPNGMGQIADNCRLISGSLRAFSDKLAFSHNTLETGGDVQTIFRMESGGNDYWLSWITDVDCVRSQIAGDTTQRIYWTGDYEPRMSNLALAIGGGSGVMPASWYVLGVTPPVAAPTVTPSGGVGAATTRAYVETFVTQYGEESAPSPVSAVTTGKVDDTWALTALNAVPPNSYAISAASWTGGTLSLTFGSVIGLRVGERVTVSGLAPAVLNASMTVASINTGTGVVGFTIADPGAITDQVGTATRDAPHNTTGMVRRIYRTLAGEYYFVVELPIATTTYNDTIADSALAEVLPSSGWDMPPVNLSGLIDLPNGFSAAFFGNELCFSVPWHPHAWPIEYRLSCAFDVVGIASFGSSIVAATKGVPYILTGSSPESMSMEKGRGGKQPCLSKRSVIGIGIGVLFSCPDGMAFENGGGGEMATAALFSRDEWSLLNPSSMRCNYHNGIVFGWHDQNASLHTGFAFEPKTGAFSATSMPTTAGYVDDETNKMYVVQDLSIYQWDAHPYNDLVYDWKSKVYALSRPVNFGYGKVDAEYDGVDDINAAIAVDTAANAALLALANAEAAYEDVNIKGTLDASMLGEFMLGGGNMVGGTYAEYAPRSLRLTIYGDGVERYAETLTNNRSFSLPRGYKASKFEFRVSGNIEAYSVAVAETATELKVMS